MENSKLIHHKLGGARRPCCSRADCAQQQRWDTNIQCPALSFVSTRLIPPEPGPNSARHPHTTLPFPAAAKTHWLDGTTARSAFMTMATPASARRLGISRRSVCLSDLHCNALRCGTLWPTAFPRLALHCRPAPHTCCIALHSPALHCAALLCPPLPYPALPSLTLPSTTVLPWLHSTARRSPTLCCTLVCCTATARDCPLLRGTALPCPALPCTPRRLYGPPRVNWAVEYAKGAGRPTHTSPSASTMWLATSAANLGAG